MTNIPILPPAEASDETMAVYKEFHEQMAFRSPPNFIMTLGHSKAAARGTWELVRHILVSGEIPRWKKELIFVAISRDRNCRYCYAAHLACCRALGVEVNTIDEMVWGIAEMPDHALRDMIMFCLKCARDPASIEPADIATLLRHDMDMSQITELVAMSALAVYATIIADASAMEADKIFESVA